MIEKLIDKKDHKKVFIIIDILQSRDEEFKGCLFIYDDNFKKEFGNLADEIYNIPMNLNLEMWLRVRS